MSGSWSRVVWSITLGLVLGTVLGVITRESLFALAVMVLGESIRPMAHLAALLPFVDPVYTHAALHSLAGMHIGGLHAEIPALLRVTLEPGSSVLGRMMSSAVGDSGVLALAVLMLRHGVHRGRLVVLAGSLAAQLQIALGVLSRPPSMADLETIGLSFAVNASVPWWAGRRLVVSDPVSTVPAPLTVAMLVGLALAAAYLVAAVLAQAAVRSRRRIPITPWVRYASPPEIRRLSAARMSVLTTGALIALSTFAAACETLSLPVTVTAAPPLDAVAPPLPDATGRVPVAVTEPVSSVGLAATPQTLVGIGDRWYRDAAPPSQVEILAGPNGFQYVVNGIPQVIHGMGVNTQYHALLSPADRQARLDADLSEMHDMGVNTLVGWDPAEFDDVLLNTAQRHGIGVVLPFDLDPNADYLDPSVRAALTQQVLAWVASYRAYPAVRMWGLGNEVLHKIVHPAWVGPQDPHQAAEARAFSDWLIETADAIHAADPNHPVTYRDAEDAFVGWISRALERSPAGRQTWFVYGTNCYQDYLDKIVDNWPDQGTGVALWVSEFAPGGLAIPDRPAGFTEMWGYVRKHPDWVLGGAVYAWTRNGPEEIDRNLGLTDDGKPADGHSLDAIANDFRNDASQ
jgi:hypothetical protein